MHATHYEALVAFILSVDRAVLVYLIPIDVFFSIAAVAMLSRGRRPLELFALFIIVFTLILAGAWLVFHGLLDHPFYRIEVVSY